MFTVFLSLFLLGLGIVVFKNRTVLSKEGFPSKIVSILLFGASVLTIVLSSFHIVPPGHRGIQVTMGDMLMTPLDEGLHFINPISSVEDKSVQTQKSHEKYTAETFNTQTITVDIIYNYSPLPDAICLLQKECKGGDYAAILIPPVLQEAVKAEIAKHNVSDVTQKRAEIKHSIESNVVSKLLTKGIKISEMGISDIDFSDKYDDAIEAKQVAEQQAYQAVNIKNKKETEAQSVVIAAQADADAKIQQARGESESVIMHANAKAKALEIEGAAQAAYNKKIAESLTPELVQKMLIEKWGGAVPQFLGANGNGINFLIPTK